MHNLQSVHGPSPVRPRRESGMALVVVLLLLLLVSAIGLGMIYMSNTESSINGNYRDSQLAFFSMRAGLEEVRDRMRTNSPWPIVPPAAMPGNANSILYVVNPAGAADVVAPNTTGNPYFDDELCHETFSAMAMANPGTNVPCTSKPPAGDVAPVVNSISPGTNTASALKFKWVRMTLKENDTFANGVPAAYTHAGQPANAQICYQSLSAQEIAVTAVAGGIYATCDAAFKAGQDASPVYVVTTMAVTASGSRRIGQYEIASLNVAGPPVALGMDGPAAVYNPTPSSSNYFINGQDNAVAGAGWGGPGSCTPTGANLPAITVGDNAGVNNITTSLQGPPDRTANYTGAGMATPSIANGSATSLSGEWSTPAQLDNLVSSIANIADTTYTCGIGAPCSPTGGVAGTNANPQITYVNGDFNLGNGSGAGVLVVTGTLSFQGNASFNGLILVIGQGAMTESGGGNGGFNGSVFMAKTHSSVAPYPELATLGTPTIAWNGGGKAFIQYNSCWAMIGNQKKYIPIATREEMY